jgi:mono/diheme cytochrome c family protein
MKALKVILGTIMLVTFAGTVAEEVVLKEEPLQWKQVKDLDGSVLFENLCAVCHGPGGTGDGPAAGALKKVVPDLTGLSAGNEGVFPREQVENAINGKARVVAHGTVEMPVWGELLEELRPDWTITHRAAFAKKRVETLTMHIESMQVE